MGIVSPASSRSWIQCCAASPHWIPYFSSPHAAKPTLPTFVRPTTNITTRRTMGCAGAKDQRSIEKRSECECCAPVCFEPLPQEPCCMLFCRGQRSCGHLMHRRCAKQLYDFPECLPKMQCFCPECHTPFDRLVPLPRLDNDVRAWFDAYAHNTKLQLAAAGSRRASLDRGRCDVERIAAEISALSLAEKVALAKALGYRPYLLV